MYQALLTALEQRNWDMVRISANLNVGDWDTVAFQVLDLMAKRAPVVGSVGVIE